MADHDSNDSNTDPLEGYPGAAQVLEATAAAAAAAAEVLSGPGEDLDGDGVDDIVYDDRGQAYPAGTVFYDDGGRPYVPGPDVGAPTGWNADGTPMFNGPMPAPWSPGPWPEPSLPAAPAPTSSPSRRPLASNATFAVRPIASTRDHRAVIAMPTTDGRTITATGSGKTARSAVASAVDAATKALASPIVRAVLPPAVQLGVLAAGGVIKAAKDGNLREMAGRVASKGLKALVELFS